MKFIFTTLLAMFILSADVVVRDAGNAVAQTRKKSARRYSCPMHPEVSSMRPGKCKKCGMALRVGNNASSTSSASKNDLEMPPTGAARFTIPDTPVLDQYGRPLNFYTDLVKGKTVAINFIFTTCTGICPMLTATFRRVQIDLGEHAERDVRLISISVDPTIDVPERLRAFAAKFNAAPGWTFVTGNKSEIDALLKTLGAATADKNDHTPMVLIGNEGMGNWTRIYGLSAPSKIARILAETANQK